MYYFYDREEVTRTVIAKAPDYEAEKPPAVLGLTGDDSHRTYLPTLFPNTGMAVHPDYLVTFQAWPDGLSKSKVFLDICVPGTVKSDVKEIMRTSI